MDLSFQNQKYVATGCSNLLLCKEKKSERVLKTVSMGEDKGEVVWMCGLVGCKGNGARVCVRSRIHFFLDRCKIILI